MPGSFGRWLVNILVHILGCTQLANSTRYSSIQKKKFTPLFIVVDCEFDPNILEIFFMSSVDSNVS
jgi:hypothetical protein